MPEKTPTKIMCDICSGWHSTEAHAQHEKDAREKRMAEIKARPDSSYRFDTLGFTPEEKEEIEPWMHEVIEKAKDLGDDLHDVDYYIHYGLLEGLQSTDVDVPSVLSMLDKSFGEAPRGMKSSGSSMVYLSEHNAGERLYDEWAVREFYKDLIVLQERWVQTREKSDLDNYIEELKRLLYTQKPWFVDQQIIEQMVMSLNSIEGRKQAMKFLAENTGPLKKGENVGIIFSLGDSLLKDPKFEIQKSKDWFHADLSPKKLPVVNYKYEGQNVAKIIPNAYAANIEKDRVVNPYGSRDPDRRNEYVGVDLKLAWEFYKKFIHGIQIPHGSIESQRGVLKRMLEKTKEKPERRLPIYNFYGKLVWPRPPKENK